MTKTITLKLLEKLGACTESILAFSAQKERSAVKVLRLLIASERWDWFSWLSVRLMTHKQKVQWAIFCAEQVIDIFEKKYPDDKRPRLAIESAKAWVRKPSAKTKNAAYAAYAAYAATNAAYAATNAAAAYAAYATAYATNATNAATAAASAAYAYAAAYAAYAYAAAYKEMRIKCAEKAINILARAGKGTK